MSAPPIHLLTWNLYHGMDGARLGPTFGSTFRGRTLDDGARLHRNRKWIAEMAAVIRDRAPTFAALQEVPPQAVDTIARLTGMHAVRSLMPTLVGPTRLRGRLADRNPDLWRTHEGTSNVVLAHASWTPAGHWTLRHNPPGFAARHGHRLRLGVRERLHWLAEPRRLVGGRFVGPDGRALTVVSLHCHNSLVWDVIAAEVARLLPKIEARVPAGEPVVVAGDFNAAGSRHPALRRMLDAGYVEETIDDLVIDHIFQRGLQTVAPPDALPTDVRELTVPHGDGTRTVLLSDHDIVAARFRLPPADAVPRTGG